MPDTDQPTDHDPQVMGHDGQDQPDVDIEDLVGDEIDPPVDIDADFTDADPDDAESEDGR